MEMDDEFLEINDLDWFATCQDGLLAYFATGGRGFVPVEVRKSITVYETIYDYFFSIEDSVGVEVVEENVPGFSSDFERERYLRSFVDMARRGLFSYDVNGGGGYSLIARPEKNRGRCDLPEGIKNIVHVLSASLSVNIEVKDLL